MYAVVKTGGKQYRVGVGDVIRVERLGGEVGETLTLGHVLALGGGDAAMRIGTPALDGVTVKTEIIAQEKSAKVIVFKKKRRHNYRRKTGHRQQVTVLRVMELMEG